MKLDIFIPTMTSPLPDRYDFASTEPEIYQAWLDAGCFDAHAEHSTRVGGTRTPYTIVMPPPNVTAILHVGHGLNNTIQDVIIRWARMRGAEALWVPGTDHAGIATQNVVEKLVATEGKTRFDLGREAFVKRTEAFVAQTGGVILEQLRAIGASADWSRTAYTLSPELSVAVREAFVRLYERGLIYRGHRVIHWCPHVAERRRGGVRRRDGQALSHRVPALRTRRSGVSDRNDAARDDARRRGLGCES
jgi:valyl-tRNA synthetase